MKSIIQILFIFCLIIPSIEAQISSKNTSAYKVVINHEEQYSIWPADKKDVDNWKSINIVGPYKKCADYVQQTWADKRPLSIRKMNLPEDTRYFVVINHEEQYSIWPQHIRVGKDAKILTKPTSLKKCHAYIEEVWTDMRPLSMRKKME